MVTMSKSCVLGPLSSREWAEAGRAVNSQAAHRVGVGACTNCFNRFFCSLCIEPLAERDRPTGFQSIQLWEEQQIIYSLKQFVPHYSSVCLWVDCVDHEVRLGVILFRVAIPKPPRTNGFHHDRCTGNLILDVAFQNPKDEMEPESCSDLFALIKTDNSPSEILTGKTHKLRRMLNFRALKKKNLCSNITS